MGKGSKVLIVGGAGYVGSATAAWMIDRGHDVWILDDLSTGHRELVLVPDAKFIRGNLGDREIVAPLLQRGQFDCVMHFAAKSIVPDSVKFPEAYRDNNVIRTKALLEMMIEAGTTRCVFSSTCAIYGDPGSIEKMDESLPKRPLSPYGENKAEVESILESFARQGKLSSIALRYFNAAGAEPKLRTGEWHEPESHLIPRVLRSAVEGRAIEIYGTDYSTRDGTCIRDYIHVTDLARAHEAAMLRLLATGEKKFEGFNLGSESGYTVREVITACEKALGTKLEIFEQPRREGDSPKLVADSARAKSALGFTIENGLEQIIESALKWESRRREIYSRAAVFLDRDGTINEDPGYLSDPSQLKLLPEVQQALADLKKAGYLLVVVSNQSGVGRGLIQPDAMPRIHARLDELLGEGKIDHYELCIHTPESGCDCRKPEPKLIAEAARKLEVDLSRSYMVGDKKSDLEAGWRAGCGKIALVRTGYGRETEALAANADFIGDSLIDVSRWILANR